MDNNDEWNNIEVPTNDQVEFELEEEVEAAPFDRDWETN